EQVQPSVFVVVHKRTSGAPARRSVRQPRFPRYFGEAAVSLIVIESVLSEVGYQQIIAAVVVIVTNASTLTPASANQVRLFCNVGKRAILVVAVKVIGGFLPLRKA